MRVVNKKSELTSFSEFNRLMFSSELLRELFRELLSRLFCRLAMSLWFAVWCCPKMACSWWNFVLWFVDVFWLFSIIC